MVIRVSYGLLLEIEDWRVFGGVVEVFCVVVVCVVLGIIISLGLG